MQYLGYFLAVRIIHLLLANRETKKSGNNKTGDRLIIKDYENDLFFHFKGKKSSVLKYDTGVLLLYFFHNEKVQRPSSSVVNLICFIQ